MICYWRWDVRSSKIYSYEELNVQWQLQRLKHTHETLQRITDILNGKEDRKQCQRKNRRLKPRYKPLWKRLIEELRASICRLRNVLH